MITLDTFPLVKIYPGAAYTANQRRSQDNNTVPTMDGKAVCVMQNPATVDNAFAFSSIRLVGLGGTVTTTAQPTAAEVRNQSDNLFATPAGAIMSCYPSRVGPDFGDVNFKVRSLAFAYYSESGSPTFHVELNPLAPQLGAPSFRACTRHLFDGRSRRIKLMGKPRLDNGVMRAAIGSDGLNVRAIQGMENCAAAVYKGRYYATNSRYTDSLMPGGSKAQYYTRYNSSADAYNDQLGQWQVNPTDPYYVARVDDGLPTRRIYGVNEQAYLFDLYYNTVSAGTYGGWNFYRTGIGALKSFDGVPGVPIHRMLWANGSLTDANSEYVYGVGIKHILDIEGSAQADPINPTTLPGFLTAKGTFGSFINNTRIVKWASWAYHMDLASPEYPYAAAGLPSWFARNFIAIDKGRYGGQDIFTIAKPVNRGPTGPYVFDPTAVFDDRQTATSLWLSDNGIVYSLWRATDNGVWLCASGFDLGFLPAPMANWARFVSTK